MLAYDDLYSIQYMKKNLRPYRRPQRMGGGTRSFLQAAARELSFFDENAARSLTTN